MLATAVPARKSRDRLNCCSSIRNGPLYWISGVPLEAGMPGAGVADAPAMMPIEPSPVE